MEEFALFSMLRTVGRPLELGNDRMKQCLARLSRKWRSQNEQTMPVLSPEATMVNATRKRRFLFS